MEVSNFKPFVSANPESAFKESIKAYCLNGLSIVLNRPPLNFELSKVNECNATAG